MTDKGSEIEAEKKQRILHEKLEESFRLLFLGQGRSDRDAEKMAEIAAGGNLQETSLAADLQETARLHARIRERFRKMFVRSGESEADAGAMADIATRGR